MCASEANWSILFVPNGEHETVRNPIDDAIGAISGLAVLETIVPDDGENVEVDPAR
jgi:hypothetical protein